MPSLSAIVATRDRPALLADCLATLVSQEGVGDELEVVVLDDGSVAPLDGVVARFAEAPVAVRLVRQEASGLSAARNHGAQVARGEILAYLDDDILADSGWARAVLGAFQDEGCDGLAGRAELQYEAEPPRWLTPGLRAYLSEYDLGDEPRWLEGAEFPFGVNCAVTRRGFDRVGGFPTDLGRQRGGLLSNEERRFFRALADGGGSMLYAPAARVLHRVPEERLTLAWFRRRAHAQGISDVVFSFPDGPPGWWWVARDAMRAGRTVPILAKSLGRGQGPQNAVVWWEYSRGRLAALRGRASA